METSHTQTRRRRGCSSATRRARRSCASISGTACATIWRGRRISRRRAPGGTSGGVQLVVDRLDELERLWAYPGAELVACMRELHRSGEQAQLRALADEIVDRLSAEGDRAALAGESPERRERARTALPTSPCCWSTAAAPSELRRSGATCASCARVEARRSDLRDRAASARSRRHGWRWPATPTSRRW